MPTIAVVILNYNGREFLRQFLPTLIRYSPEATVYVADNHSTDDSLQVLADFPQVHTLILPENYGYAGGYNEALKQISSDYYLLVNSDVEVTPGWIPPLLGFLEDHPQYAAVQPKILDFNHREQFEYAGAAGGYLDLLGYPFCRGRIFNILEKDQGQYDTPEEVFWATGACFMIRSSSFHKVEGFDSTFFAHMEEIDLCWRLRSTGEAIACVAQSHVYHVGGGTLHKTSPHKTYLNFRNGLFLLIKNLPKPQLLWVLPLRILLDWAASLLLWKNQSFIHSIAVLRAHKDVLINTHNYIRRSKRSSTRLQNQKRILLPFRHYLSGKKCFSEL